MNDLLRTVAFCVTFVLACAAEGAIAQSSDPFPTPADIRIELNDGLLTLATRDAPLHEVVREIGEIAGFETLVVGTFTEPQRVNASFENLTVREAVERLVGAENRIIVYAPSAAETSQRVIAQVWLLQVGTTQTDMTLKDKQSIASGSEQDVNGYKLARLTVMLQPDKSEIIRTWAATALGTFQDDRAVLALESALADDSPAVRLEAINALGRIGSEPASMALASVLLDDNTAETERAAAISALSRHDTAAAREYLGTGGGVIDAHGQ